MIAFDKHEWVRRHFVGESSTFADRRLFRHLRRCESCRHEYRTYSALESLDRDGDDRARERLARTIFPAPPRRRTLFGAGFGVVALACTALMVSWGRTSTPEPFQARGGGQTAALSSPSLEVFRVGADGRGERAGSTIRADEALAFSFVNPGAAGPATHLMVFARDVRGRVFWFWPAWDNPADNPSSVPIPGTERPAELGEAVRHALQPGSLTMFGLFTQRPVSVRQVEAALAAGEGGLGALGVSVWKEMMEVLP